LLHTPAGLLLPLNGCCPLIWPAWLLPPSPPLLLLWLLPLLRDNLSVSLLLLLLLNTFLPAPLLLLLLYSCKQEPFDLEPCCSLVLG
jgi:hypothetical protein